MAEDLSFLQSIQVLAMEAAVKPDWEAVYRRICRWYSKNFHTPLDAVLDLPQYWVLQNYYESLFDDQAVEDRRQTFDDLIMTPEQRRAREVAEAKHIRAATEDINDKVARIRKKIAASGGIVEKATDRLGKLSKKQAKAKNLDEIRDALKDAGSKPAPVPKNPEAMVAEPSFEWSMGGDAIDLDADPLGMAFPETKPKK